MEGTNATREEVAQQLREVRKSQGMTQELLADRVGTKKSNISRLESGRYNPSLDFLVKVAGGQKVFTMLQHRKRSMQIFVILPQSIMRNPMGRASWHLHRTIFEQMDCISLMSRRRHCLHSGSLHC